MATLKALVDETTNIKNELVTCHTNLKTNLTAKGVTVGASDKMSNLIDKVPLIKSISSVVPGDDVIIYSYDSFTEGYTLSIDTDMSKAIFNGGYRVKFRVVRKDGNTGTVRGYVQQIRNGNVVFQSKNFDTSSTSGIECIVDLTDFKVGDSVVIKGSRPVNYPTVRIGAIKITTNYVIS